MEFWTKNWTKSTEKKEIKTKMGVATRSWDMAHFGRATCIFAIGTALMQWFLVPIKSLMQWFLVPIKSQDYRGYGGATQAAQAIANI